MASEPRPGPRSGLREFCLDDGKPELESYSQTSLFLDLQMPSLSSYTMPKPNICYKGHVVPISFLLFLTVLKRIRGEGSACGLETLRETDFGDRGSSTAYSNT